MKKSIFILSVFLLFVVSRTMAGITGKIAGKVTDAKTGKPLFGADVIIEGTKQGAATDNKGNYFVINLSPGKYTVRAQMMGYAALTKTDVIVAIDHTVTVDFALTTTVLMGKGVTIVAPRDVIAFDVAATQVSLDAAEVKGVPQATTLQQVINLQAGVDFDPTTRGYSSPAEVTIRGGGRGQNALMVDGLMMVDDRANRPMMNVNLSAVQAVNIIKGGFNAEYGNVRSGLINIVTKEGSPNRYNGSLEARITPGHLKHSGVSIFNPNNYFLRPYLDPAVCYVGTANGTWDAATQARYPSFMGWNEFANTLTGMTADDARNLFIWQHRAQGSDALGRKAGSYGDKPDWDVEGSLGGPVPFLSKKLGGLSFFASYRTHNELFALPTNRDYYQEQNSQLKLTAKILPSLKLTLDGLYSETHTVQSAPRADGMDAYMTSGTDILYSAIATGYDYVLGQNAALYYPAALNNFDIYRSMEGISIDHVLSRSTFYNVRISMSRVQNFCGGPSRFRDETTIRNFGSTAADETPLGYKVGIFTMYDGMSTSGEGSVRDYSEVNTVNAKVDMTSQVNKYNEVKIGAEFNYDDINTHYEHNQIGDTGNNWVVEWRRFPYRGGAYVQDKLEFKGMIANIGLRADMNFPNSKAFATERYSMYFRKKFMETFQQLAPSEPAKNHLKLSPRLGISHPISDKAKLYFNYGHFYSMPTSNEMFMIMKRSKGLSDIGNPSVDMPKTVAYELGVEYNISNMFMLHLSGYYKDVSDQLANIHYVGYDGGVDYWSRQNQNYEDIRGFEVRIEKRLGSWVTGWANYNYMVTSSGYIGRQTYYEDPRRQEQEGLMNPVQNRPHVRPLARANITFTSPADFGPTIAGFKPAGGIRLDLLYQWRAGKYETPAAYSSWNPKGDVNKMAELQWKGRTTCDLRLSKNIKKMPFSLYMDIANLFNIKYLEESGFANATDRMDYMRSLHLARYAGDNVATAEEYKAMGYTAGNDKPGDVKSKDKPYINMPNREFLTFLNPRTITFGIRLNF